MAKARDRSCPPRSPTRARLRQSSFSLAEDQTNIFNVTSLRHIRLQASGPGSRQLSNSSARCRTSFCAPLPARPFLTRSTLKITRNLVAQYTGTNVIQHAYAASALALTPPALASLAVATRARTSSPPTPSSPILKSQPFFHPLRFFLPFLLHLSRHVALRRRRLRAPRRCASARRGRPCLQFRPAYRLTLQKG